MTAKQKKIQEDAFEWVKQHKKDLFLKFANPAFYPQDLYPTTVFMAGSPGAGKTEFSKNFRKPILLATVKVNLERVWV